jgi:16S rRNA (uracil1498-N3)-methyltransferase
VESQKLIRLFVTASLADGAAVELGQEQAHYVKNVMRLKEGDALALFNGSEGEFGARIESFAKRAARLRVEDRLRAQQSEPDLWLVFAPLKRARIDYLVEKATELGASALVPA